MVTVLITDILFDDVLRLEKRFPSLSQKENSDFVNVLNILKEVDTNNKKIKKLNGELDFAGANTDVLLDDISLVDDQNSELHRSLDSLLDELMKEESYAVFTSNKALLWYIVCSWEAYHRENVGLKIRTEFDISRFLTIHFI